MRIAAAILLPLFTSACLAPGERDPTRYPWDLPAQPVRGTGEVGARYCLVSLEPTRASGISVGGAPVNLACTQPAPQPRKRKFP